MAFSSVLVSREVTAKGLIKEKYTWDGDSVTTGQITVDSTDADSIGEIVDIEYAVASNDNNANTAVNWGLTTVDLTFSSGNTGKLVVFGKAK